ncbi:MAG: acetate/propionate family kinase [Nitrospiraceae bacterium]|nr:MAG: acetate/propionate family kinase [Nitrospiraceae bacterium]
MIILTINTGSSSVRLGLFEKTSTGLTRLKERRVDPDEDLPEHLLENFLRERSHLINAVAHRIVHGGSALTDSCVINEQVEKKIDRLGILAPLHNPVALKWVRACRAVTGEDVSQVAVFDTAFYSTMPEVSSMYALPKNLCREHGIRRYGFHGIAHRAMLQRLQKLRPDIGTEGKIISIQLGSGCSMTAIKQGRAVDTSMGFSPNEGLVMSTRSGDIDSGVLVYLQNRAGYSIHEIDKILNSSSGLFGVSGLSGDMKFLLASDRPEAKRAVELYCYRVRKYIGSFIAVLGGVDCILFGGGVGENSSLIRKRIIENMEWCGITFDEHANDETIGKEGFIHSEHSRVPLMVVPVEEADVLAEEAVNVL